MTEPMFSAPTRSQDRGDLGTLQPLLPGKRPDECEFLIQHPEAGQRHDRHWCSQQNHAQLDGR